MDKSPRTIYFHTTAENTALAKYLKSHHGLTTSSAEFKSILAGENWGLEKRLKTIFSFDSKTGRWDKTKDWDETHVILNTNSSLTYFSDLKGTVRDDYGTDAFDLLEVKQQIALILVWAIVHESNHTLQDSEDPTIDAQIGEVYIKNYEEKDYSQMQSEQESNEAARQFFRLLSKHLPQEFDSKYWEMQASRQEQESKH
ncbi:MAG TPA: hypothetical protein VFW07_25610 [Parafilimonas sp.]|nr:hypothetical protein [Parafilimonas sp.]